MYKYENCGEKDITLCPRQVQLCPISACAPELNVCKVVCTWQGRRRCPYGRMLKANGKQVYCDEPIDCTNN
jgi:hypothetical protein